MVENVTFRSEIAQIYFFKYFIVFQAAIFNAFVL